MKIIVDHNHNLKYQRKSKEKHAHQYFFHQKKKARPEMAPRARHQSSALHHPRDSQSV